jgi:oligopeptidase A
MTNPLLDFSDLPRFDQIRPEHVAPAMDDLLASAESALATVTAPDFPAKWTSIATVLDVATERLGRAWGAVAHLNSVADTPELRAAFNAVLPKSHRILDPPGCRRTPLCQVQGHRPLPA